MKSLLLMIRNESNKTIRRFLNLDGDYFHNTRSYANSTRSSVVRLIVLEVLG